MTSDKKRILYSLVFPFIFVFILWMVKVVEVLLDISLVNLGIYPLSAKGLPGIITAPLIHSDFSHLVANSTSLFVLLAVLFYFYKEIAFKIFFLIYLFTDIWIWFGAREAFHIGASGLVYGLVSFLFVSGIIRRNPRLMAITLLVTFLYGSLIWGIFPEFFPGRNISWESHLMGLIAGFVLAIYFRGHGPQRKKYEWQDEDEDDDENAYWKTADPKEI
ncbi:MAG: rhomboid family intramembrane serine protease [Bacteroidetes bacterium]|nr:rhomboid family intramembrane serine protease [Bacteroidota bacterium]